MGFVVLGHGENRDQRNGAVLASQSACSLIERREVGVHIAGIAAASGNLLTRRRNLTERVGVVGDVGHDNEHVHAQIESEIFRCGQRHFWGGDTLDRGVVRKVDEHDGSVDRAGLLEGLDEVIRLLKGDTHCGENNGELLVLSSYGRLTGDLSRELRVGKTRSGENRQLLTSYEGVQTVDRGDTCLDKFLRIVACCRVHGGAVDVHTLLGNQRGTVVDGIAQTVENAGEHVGRYGKLHRASEESHLGACEVDARGGVKKLNKRVGAVDLKHLAAACFAARQLDFTQLVIFDVIHVADHHQRTRDLTDSTVFLWHQSSLLFRTSAISLSS